MNSARFVNFGHVHIKWVGGGWGGYISLEGGLLFVRTCIHRSWQLTCSHYPHLSKTLRGSDHMVKLRSMCTCQTGIIAQRGVRCAAEPKSVCLSREIFFLSYFFLLPPPLFFSPLHVTHRCHIVSASDHWSLGPWFTKCSRRMVGDEKEEEELSVSLGNGYMAFFASPYLLEACVSPGSRQVESIAPVLICNSGHVLSSDQQIADHDICTERWWV